VQYRIVSIVFPHSHIVPSLKNNHFKAIIQVNLQLRTKGFYWGSFTEHNLLTATSSLHSD